MSKIKIMSENLANKIAAGEVIERCSSIVKELVENSIDANAQNIIVNLKDGGLKEIEVIDDGIGMDKVDALNAFSRHATSKLYKEDDLFFIDTLGFRGEALPSIASVSEVEMHTLQDNVGTLILIKGGKVLKNENVALNQGTRIKVTNLFYNTPARLKYLKSEQTELASCVNFIERLAFSKPQISFTLTNNERVLVKTSGSGSLLKTIHEIYGLEVSKKMLLVEASCDDFDIYGYVCKPEILKSNRNHLITIVNGRIVRNNDINRAINDAYYTYKPDTKYPVVILNINTDPTLVDVNIHPTKQDIKLSKMKVLTDLIYDNIKKVLYQNLLIPDAIKKESKPMYSEEQEKLVNLVVEENETQEEYNQVELNLALDEEQTKEEDKLIVNAEFKKLKLYPVGLALGTYIIAQNEEGIFLIDQHAAQERINYERNMKALANKEVTTTDLLIPITIELSQSEFLKIKENIDVLTEMGFNIEEFGVNTFVFKSHPTWLREGYEEESIRKILDLIIGGINKFDRVKFNESIAITLACKMSIKANMHISIEAIEELLDELCSCDNPYNCPHGRPTIIKFTKYDLERMFKRVMN